MTQQNNDKKFLRQAMKLEEQRLKLLDIEAKNASVEKLRKLFPENTEAQLQLYAGAEKPANSQKRQNKKSQSKGKSPKQKNHVSLGIWILLGVICCLIGLVADPMLIGFLMLGLGLLGYYEGILVEEKVGEKISSVLLATVFLLVGVDILFLQYVIFAHIPLWLTIGSLISATIGGISWWRVFSIHEEMNTKGDYISKASRD